MKTETTADEAPVRQLGVDIDRRLHKRFGEIGDTYVLMGLAYLEGLDEDRTQRSRTGRDSIIAISGKQD